MKLKLKDMRQLDPNVKQVGFGVWFEPIGPNVTYYYDVVRNTGGGGEQGGDGHKQIDSKYLGCFKDQGDPTGTRGRDINGYVENNNSMTIDRCVNTCAQRGFAYAGLQYSSWCFCGNSYGRSGQSGSCNMPCAGNRGQTCGGSWGNSVYSTGAGYSR